MRHRAKGVVLISLVLGYILLGVGPARAMTMWTDGVVTKAPWVDRYDYIEVDGVKFIVMPGTKIERVYGDRSGMSQREPIPLGRIQTGQTITMRIHGLRIYQILIEE